MLLIRTYIKLLLEDLTIITIVGAMTAFFAATTGLLQNDLK